MLRSLLFLRLLVAFYGSVEIISSTFLITDLGTEFGFRSYYFLTLFVVLGALVAVASICMNIGCSVILIDWAFLLKQVSRVYVRTMAFLILVRGIGANYHSINEYVLFDIYLSGKSNDKEVRAKIIREAYLIDGLKVKMLLDIDVIGPKKIDIITSKS